jgi:hypothetical protein
MAEAGDFSARVHLGGFILEAADQNHPSVQIQQLTFIHGQQGTFCDVFFTFQGHRHPSPAPRTASMIS